MDQAITLDKIIEIRENCACLQARRRARLLTKAYDEILAPSGLKMTQFSTLAMLIAGPLGITKLSETLGLDRTTLSRNIAGLERKGYVVLGASTDARERQVTITPSGGKAVHWAYGLWQEAQLIYAGEVGSNA